MRRSIFGAVAFAAVALAVVLSGAASAAKAPPIKNCPSTLDGFLAASNVDASFTSVGNTTTYKFDSLQDQSPSGGVPGLVGYCVYTSGVVNTADATPADWKQDWNGGNVSFVRGNGNKTNIPLDGTTGTQIGTATFTTTPPATQNILLHIADQSTCEALYGVLGVATCFVLPKAGPICDAGTGNTDAAYNAIPTDVEHCAPPSLGFEANQVAEFGDRVTLDTTGGTNLLSMTVDFQSYGCSDSGHWNTGATEPCVTTSGETFTVPGGITAKIYSVVGGTLGPVIATSDVLNPAIPFRPTADPINCPGPGGNGANDVGSRWFDPVSGACNYSLSVPLTFTFPAGTTFTSGQEVVWTVQFDTTHYGYSPIGEATTCFASAPGCGYDSLNVGAKSYSGAPYAGTDVNEDVAYLSTGGSLATDTGWIGFRPLGQIVLG